MKSTTEIVSQSKMFMFFVSIVLATAAGVTAFLLLVSGDMKKFKQTFMTKKSEPKFPMITPTGEVVGNPEELEAHLGVLETKLSEKRETLEYSRSKVFDAKENIEKLNTTASEVKKYYLKLKGEILRSEEECKVLQKQIEDYKQRQEALYKVMKQNESFYKRLIDTVQSNDSTGSYATLTKNTSSDISKQSSLFEETHIPRPLSSSSRFIKPSSSGTIKTNRSRSLNNTKFSDVSEVCKKKSNKMLKSPSRISLEHHRRASPNNKTKSEKIPTYVLPKNNDLIDTPTIIAMDRKLSQANIKCQNQPTYCFRPVVKTASCNKLDCEELIEQNLQLVNDRPELVTTIINPSRKDPKIRDRSPTPKRE